MHVAYRTHDMSSMCSAPLRCCIASFMPGRIDYHMCGTLHSTTSVVWVKPNANDKSVAACIVCVCVCRFRSRSRSLCQRRCPYPCLCLFLCVCSYFSSVIVLCASICQFFCTCPRLVDLQGTAQEGDRAIPCTAIVRPRCSEDASPMGSEGSVAGSPRSSQSVPPSSTASRPRVAVSGTPPGGPGGDAPGRCDLASISDVCALFVDVGMC